MIFEQSKRFHRRAEIIPGRSYTRSKAPGRLFDAERGPLYVSHASGATIVDVDGNEFVDMLCALGAISLGYGVVDSSNAGNAGVYSLPHYVEVQAAEEMLRHVAPWARFAKSVRTGSEATTAAVLIARRATGRRPIFVAREAYHAWHPWASMREEESTFQYKYNSIESVKQLVAQYGAPAAIVVEPARWEETYPEFLLNLQRLARDLQALFVVDEMVYGGRMALGGSCEIYKLTPDLATFGKAIGNGLPVAFIVGGDALVVHGEIVSGTYSGDVGSLSTVISVLAYYRVYDVVEALWKKGSRLKENLKKAIEAAGAQEAVTPEGHPTHQRLKFKNPGAGREFAAEMAARGFLWHPDVTNVCYSHTFEQLDRCGHAAHDSLKALREKGWI